ncbi:arylsulfatase [Crateriforma spongiae]|uniref:arylsulfatase n=1 Tax=Crateriforma spongiae TaxID=2724528 RepID=UPI001448761C|nr:arylsulfatase [Crateriforma spongiae]
MNRIIPHLATVLLMALPIAFAPLQAAANDAKPNVIVIMTDDQGYGEFSCHGNPIVQTTNIDKLASQSIRLTDFHVAPMCTPTRGQLMTGLDAFRNAAINVSSGRTLLRHDAKTIADVFGDAGYRTGIFGKWHLGDNYPFRPEDRGFDEAIWFPSSHINSVPDYWDNDYFDDVYIHNGKRERYDGYCTDVFFDEAQKWIGQKDDQPFFAYIATNAAHWPWFVPDEYRQPIRDAIKRHPEVVQHLSETKIESLVSFLAMGANIDDNVGGLDRFLAEKGLLENTIVVFLTDNGSTMGPDYFNAGMRGKKTQLWEGGHRVPCFIRWPDGPIAAPKDFDELCQVQDLLPTLADLAGIANIPDDLDGISLAPLIRGQRESLDDRMLVMNYSRMPTFKVKFTNGNPAVPQKNGAGVLWKQWRLLENRQLFNVDSDPHQDRNVAAKHPKLVARMRSHLNQWWDGVKDDVNTPQRVVIGSDQENPMMLTACEWLDVFVDQQIQVRHAVLKDGVWHLNVAEAGTYQLELRRWPRESQLPLQAGVDETPVTDGVFPAGQSLPIEAAILRVGDSETKLSPDANGQSFTTTVELDEGPLLLQATFVDAQGDSICGAYYVYVNRMTPASR